MLVPVPTRFDECYATYLSIYPTGGRESTLRIELQHHFHGSLPTCAAARDSLVYSFFRFPWTRDRCHSLSSPEPRSSQLISWCVTHLPSRFPVYPNIFSSHLPNMIVNGGIPLWFESLRLRDWRRVPLQCLAFNLDAAPFNRPPQDPATFVAFAAYHISARAASAHPY